MKKEDAIKYLQQLYPNGGHCWLDEQRIEAIGMAVKALQEEPTSEDLEEAASRYAKEEYNHKSPATLPDRCIGCYAPLMYAFKAGAEWKEKRLLPMIDKICGMCQKQQDFINSKDLGGLISTLSRRYPEVSFAKLSRIAVRVAKWQKEQMMANAIDGKVIANGMGNPILHLWDKGRHLIDKKVKVILIKED